MIEIEKLYELYRKCTGICTDSRKITEGCMFFALKGENFDGNDFAVQALKDGARYAVVDRVSLEAEHYKGRKCILVENSLKTLQTLAKHHRRQFDIPVVGITGTNGKTTTKELISAVLASKYRIVATQGNFNNHIGVPLTLLRIDRETEIAVVEMGASAPGEIASLVEIAQPTCGLITNVGKAHLQGFGSFEGVKKTKGELYDYLRQKGGAVFYNADNQHLQEMVGYRKGLILRPYGVQLQQVGIAPFSFENPFLTLNISTDRGERSISTKLVGDYNADNVLAALCVGKHFDVHQADAIRAIEAYKPSNNRSQFIETGRNKVIMDAYNANPTSMAASLDNFASLDYPDKVLILGDMLELGPDSEAEHKAVLKKALSITDTVYLVGGEFDNALRQSRSKNGAKCFATSDKLKEFLAGNPLDGCTILVKGSNGTRLQGLQEIL